MSEVIPLLGGFLLLFVLPILLIARAARARLWWLALLWFLSPLVVLMAVLLEEMARNPGDSATRPENVQATIGFVIGLGIIPWAIIWSLGMAIALMLRRRLAPAAQPMPTADAGLPMSVAAQVPDAPLPPAMFQGMTTQDLHERVRDLAGQHGWTERLLPISYARDHDTPYVEVDHRGFHMATYDRGQAYGELETQDLEEMLYWVADQVTYYMASEEVARGISHFDEFAPRLLARQDSMLAAMNPEWHQRWLGDAACHAAFYRRKTQTS